MTELTAEVGTGRMGTVTRSPAPIAGRVVPAGAEDRNSPGRLRLVIAGSVDDGKSTLVGRLLLDTKSILADQHLALERASRTRGADALELALATDGLRAEREQGITIDVAYRYFATPRRSFMLADTPGHVQYTRNTVTGASTADAALVLVDVRNGVVAQTRTHAAVLALLRVPRLIFVINKMDMVSWQASAFQAVAAEIASLGGRLSYPEVDVVPVSALTGDGVVSPAADAPWYPGPPLLRLLEELQVPGDQAGSGPLRLPVQLVIRPRAGAHADYRGLAGTVVSGRISVGDPVIALPSGRRSSIAAIDTPGGTADLAVAGEAVTVRLADELDVGRGEVLTHPASTPRVTRDVDAVLTWLADAPGRVGRRVLVKTGTNVTRGLLTSLADRFDAHRLTWAQGGAEPLALNDIARVRLSLAAPVAVDDYAESRATGSLLVIDPDTGATLAAGTIGDPLPGDGAR